MDYRPQPQPEVFTAGYVTDQDETQIEVGGGAYQAVPVVGNTGGLPRRSSVLLARLGRGQVALQLGGYYAPAGSETTP